ncbi:MAG TPA: EscU/YscU/HrcU family type III secretion system export apparatus switch protein [Herbaspirillum sp.]|nr:EscU/YscU/HrcU family type III secretion system export apparatus switch protein [Herbaspirillum sp.]
MSDGKTEKATPRRRQEARKEGQVARSEDLTHVLLFGLFFSYLIIDGARLCAELIDLIVLPYRYLDQPFPAAAETLTTLLLSKALGLIFFVLIAAVVLSFAIQLLQIGPLFSTKSITPSLKKLDVLKNIKEIFSVNTIVDLLKMIIKTVLMCMIIYIVLIGNLRMLLLLPSYGIPGILYAEGHLMQQLTITIFFIFSVIALFDFFWQRHRLDKQLMMQKHEVKREHKDNEGDPHAKGYRRNLFREIISGDVSLVPRASVVVANPTHLAVALYYKPPATGLPIILLKGSGAGAAKIFKAARRSGVPIIQNVGLARSLFPLKVYSAIPSELFDAVAEIIVAARQIQRAASGEDMDPAPPEKTASETETEADAPEQNGESPPDETAWPQQ